LFDAHDVLARNCAAGSGITKMQTCCAMHPMSRCRRTYPRPICCASRPPRISWPHARACIWTSRLS
jgi:hypothetical protein